MRARIAARIEALEREQQTLSQSLAGARDMAAKFEARLLAVQGALVELQQLLAEDGDGEELQARAGGGETQSS